MSVAERTPVAEILAKYQRAAKRVRHGVARQVILGGTQAAAQNDNIGLAQRFAHGRTQSRAIIAYDQLAQHFHPERVELIGEEQGVGVDAPRSEQLRADGDDFRVCRSATAIVQNWRHYGMRRPSIPTSAR